jgi:hypothetical protein
MPQPQQVGINDSQRVVDGFRGLPLGMDGSKDPILTPEGAVFYAQNVTFRGGSGPKTRPGFEYRAAAQGSGLFQGWAVHYAAVSSIPSVILYVVGGNVYEYNPHANTTSTISTAATKFATDRPIYFCQASRFTIIQDGLNDPRIYISTNTGTDKLKLVSDTSLGNPAIPNSKRIPRGTHMAYGQGRLFVATLEDATTPSTIWAGDIAFGGSSANIPIESSEYNSTSGRTKVFVTTQHQFQRGSFVTIKNHSTQQSIDSTYEVIEIDGATPKKWFEVFANGNSPGKGGEVSDFTAGKDTDIIHFTEHFYIAEGGALTLSAELGRIRGLSFLPVQDTSAGQGDLVAFCERGATSFAVSLPRSEWKTTAGFQKILFLNIGAVSDSICPVNGDLYFRSLDGNGIRSYRNARAEFDGYGQTPVSSEVDPILLRDTDFLLQKDRQIQAEASATVFGLGTSFAYFDNRLLMTCLPQATTGTPSRVVFNGVIALDFKSSSGNFSNNKSSAVYDGVWTGLKALSLVSGEFTGRRRAFAMCFHNNVNEIWEISKDNEFDKPSSSARSNIVCSVTTPNFNFKSASELKKLIRADLWFDMISGGPTSALDVVLFYRPDSSPEYVQWATWTRCFTTEYTNGIAPIDLVTPYAKGYAPQLRAPTPSNTANEITGIPDNLGYDFGLKIKWTGQGRLNRLLVHALKVVEKVGGGY